MEINEQSEDQGTPILNAVLALLGAIMWVSVSNDKYHDLGFFSLTFIFILATGFGFVGANIGDFLRKAAMPSAILTSGGMREILWQKLFWFMGPQVIGAFFGGGVGCLIILKITGHKM